MNRQIIAVSIGEIATARGETTMEACALGSCVGLCLWDKQRKLGGMAHILLPAYDKAFCATEAICGEDLGKYADLAIDVLLLTLCRMGAVMEEIVAMVVGGASMFSFGAGGLLGRQVGERNVEAVVGHLQRLGIPLVFRDTGGICSRSIQFAVDSGQVTQICRQDRKKTVTTYPGESSRQRTASQILAAARRTAQSAKTADKV